MSCQAAALSERFGTHSALVWSFVGVIPHVNSQTVFSFKLFVTESAVVRGFAGVRPHVSCQIAIYA